MKIYSHRRIKISSNQLLVILFRKKRYFHEIFAKNENLSLLSSKNISSNQVFSNLFSKPVTFTKFLPKMRDDKKFRNFHRVRNLLSSIAPIPQTLREIKYTIPINLTVTCFHVIFSKHSKQWNVICPCFLKFPSIFFLKQFSTSLLILHVQNLSTYLLTVQIFPTLNNFHDIILDTPPQQ